MGYIVISCLQAREHLDVQGTKIKGIKTFWPLKLRTQGHLGIWTRAVLMSPMSPMSPMNSVKYKNRALWALWEFWEKNMLFWDKWLQNEKKNTEYSLEFQIYLLKLVHLSGYIKRPFLFFPPLRIKAFAMSVVVILAIICLLKDIATRWCLLSSPILALSLVAVIFNFENTLSTSQDVFTKQECLGLCKSKNMQKVFEKYNMLCVCYCLSKYLSVHSDHTDYVL